MSTTPKYYDTVAAAVTDIANISIGDVLIFKDRASSEWDVIDATTVTENSYNPLAGNASKSFLLRSNSVSYTNETLIPAQWGILPDGSDVSTGVQVLIDYAEANGDLDIEFPAGTFYFASPVRTSVESVQFTLGTTSSLHIYGAGKATIFKGTGAAVATYDGDGANDGSDSILRIHKSNVIVSNIQFRESPVGLYMGHDTDLEVRGSHVSIGRFENLWFQKCGTCILQQPGKSLFYNKFDSIQFQDFQIAVHCGLPPLDPDGSGICALDVNNRNFYSDMSMNNGWVGFMIENGDSCTVNSCNFESISGTANAIGSAPAQLLDSIATGIYTNQSAHSYGVLGWKLINCHAEACTRDLYLDNVDFAFDNSAFDITKITLVGNNPHYIGTAMDGFSGKYSSFNWGDLHVKFRPNGPDPFIPNAGDTPGDRGIYVDGGRISDDDSRRKSYDISAATHVTSVDAGDTVYWSLGGVHEWFGNVEFTKDASLSASEALRLTIPVGSQDTIFYDMVVPCYAEASAVDRELVEAKFRNNAIAQIDISAPTGGWTATGNKVYFHFRWYSL